MPRAPARVRNVRAHEELGRGPVAAPAADSVLVLRCLDRGTLATKTHAPAETVPYRAGKWFAAESHTVASLADLAALITELEGDPRAFIVRGRLTNDRTDARRVRRTYRPDEETPHPAIEPADHRWLCGDLDGAAAPSWLDPADPASLRRAVRWAVEKYLPPEFRGVACFYQWSSSAGVKPWSELRLHLWFLCDRPVCDVGVKAWLKPCPLDGSLYQPVQPHWCAAPLFKGGRPDPLPPGLRSGLLDGEPEVQLPPEVYDLAELHRRETEAAAVAKQARRKRKAAIEVGELLPATGEVATGYARRQLDTACGDIRAALVPTKRHARIFQVACTVGPLIGAGLLSRNEAEPELIAALDTLPGRTAAVVDNERQTIRDGLAAGARKPFDVSTLAAPERVPLSEAESLLAEVIAGACTWAAEKPGNVALVSAPPGLGKTREALRLLAAKRGRGTLLGESHRALDEREAEAEALGLTRRRRFRGLLAVMDSDGAPVCLHVEAVKAAGAAGFRPRADVCLYCPDRTRYDEKHELCCAYEPKVPPGGVVFATHAHAETLARADELATPIICDELPALLDRAEVDRTPGVAVAAFEALTVERADIDLRGKWAAPLAPLARIITRAACTLLAEHRRAPAKDAKIRGEWRERTYPPAVHGEVLARRLREAAGELAAGGQRDLLREPETAGREHLAAATTSAWVHLVEEPRPPRPEGNPTEPATWHAEDLLRPDIGDLLRAVAGEATAADETRPRGAACLRVSGTGPNTHVRVELRRRVLDWRTKDGAPLSVVVLDASGAWTEAELRAAVHGRVLRMFTVPEVAEAEGAVRRLHIRTSAMARARLLARGRGPGLTDRGDAALARVLRRLGRRLGREGESLSLGIITHKPIADLLRTYQAARDGDSEAAARVEDLNGARVLAELQRWRESRRVGELVLGHYKAQRGSNEFEDCDALAFIGAPVPNLGQAEEDARVLGVDSDQHVRALVAAELVQAEGRARAVRRTGDNPVLVVGAGRDQPPGWAHLTHEVDAMPEGGPTPSEAAEDLADLAVDMVETFGAVSVGLLTLLAGKPSLFQGVDQTRLTAIKGESYYSSYARLGGVHPTPPYMSHQTASKVLARTLSHLSTTTTPDPTRPPGAGGYWRWYELELRPGAAEELCELVRRALANEPDKLPDWAEAEEVEP